MMVTRERLLTCTICRSHFQQKCDLSKHLVDVHTNNMKKPRMKTKVGRLLTCTICKSHFQQKKCLTRHFMDVHIIGNHREQSFWNRRCRLSSRRSTDVMEYSRVNCNKWRNKRKSSTFMDCYCPEASIQGSTIVRPPSNDARLVKSQSVCCRNQLESSIKVKGRPFTCAKCGFSFIHKSHLGRHLLDVHSQERPFNCKKCGSAFKRKSDMKKHSLHHCRRKKKHSSHRGCDSSPPCKLHPSEFLVCKNQIPEPAKRSYINEFVRWIRTRTSQ